MAEESKNKGDIINLNENRSQSENPKANFPKNTEESSERKPLNGEKDKNTGDNNKSVKENNLENHKNIFEELNSFLSEKKEEKGKEKDNCQYQEYKFEDYIPFLKNNLAKFDIF